jgi:protein-arginine kinase activator protein McsA
MRASNATGALPAISVGRSYSGSFDFEALISSLRDLFAHDRQIASQQDGTRCGICYLYYTVSELHYREEEGFYVCSSCERALSKQVLPMVRRQHK